MRIFSKFTDYYDNIVPYSKEDRVWERKPVGLKLNFSQQLTRTYNGLSAETESILVKAFEALPRFTIERKFNNRTRFENANATRVIIGFCGKLYPVFLLDKPNKYQWRATQYVAYLANTECNEFISEYYRLYQSSILIGRYFGSSPDPSRIMRQWAKEYHESPNYEKIFIELKTPIFIIKHEDALYYDYMREVRENNLIINFDMSGLYLQRIFDPYTAYQEIDMYLNNQLVMCESADLVRTDELIRDSKGMDEWSFRQKGPKKRKQKSC